VIFTRKTWRSGITIFQAWATAARRFGFEQYDSCVVESLDLLKRKGGEEIQDQIYWFKDKSDRELALRAEMTPTLARMIVAKQKRVGFSRSSGSPSPNVSATNG